MSPLHLKWWRGLPGAESGKYSGKTLLLQLKVAIGNPLASGSHTFPIEARDYPPTLDPLPPIKRKEKGIVRLELILEDQQCF